MSDNGNGLRIVQFKASNIKRLTAVEIKPCESGLQVIAGKNGAGKSSVLDAIWYALGGNSNIPSLPVRNGAEEAEVTLDLGELQVIRRWYYGKQGDDEHTLKSKLEVRSKDGAKYDSPQDLLDKLTGKLTFDPMAFQKLPAREQREMLLSMVELKIDLKEFADKRKVLFDERTAVGRELNQKRGALAELPPPEDDLPDEELSIARLTDKLKIAGQAKIERDDHLKAIEENQASLDEISDEIDKIEIEIKSLRLRQEELRTTEDSLSDKLEELFGGTSQYDTVDSDYDNILKQMQAAEDINRRVRAAVAYRKAQVELESKESEYGKLTIEISNLDTQKADALKAASFPIPGLSISDDGVIYNDLPLEQASDAEQLRVSVALAMALNPKLRILRVKNGSLLDGNSRVLLEELAKREGYQIWTEIVSDDKELGVYIEDGTIANAPTAVGASL